MFNNKRIKALETENQSLLIEIRDLQNDIIAHQKTILGKDEDILLLTEALASAKAQIKT